MNGKPLSELHGAPLRLRNELELGFKQVKWLQTIEFVETFKQLGSGEGGFNEDNDISATVRLFDFFCNMTILLSMHPRRIASFDTRRPSPCSESPARASCHAWQVLSA